MEGEGHFMDDKDNNNAKWAVGDDGGGGKHKHDCWANVQQRNCLLSQHPSAVETGV
jgi:hypothetical protein